MLGVFCLVVGFSWTKFWSSLITKNDMILVGVLNLVHFFHCSILKFCLCFICVFEVKPLNVNRSVVCFGLDSKVLIKDKCVRDFGAKIFQLMSFYISQSAACLPLMCT